MPHSEFSKFMNPPVDFMNPPIEEEIKEDTKTPTRTEIIINNILCKICETTEMSKEEYDKWLRLEVGMTQEEICHLKNVDCLPEMV